MPTLMLYLFALVIFAIAQAEGVQPCCGVNPNTIPENIKESWCQNQRTACNTICGQHSFPGSNCDAHTLQFECRCPNGYIPNLAFYETTIPSLMCNWWVSACVNASSISSSSCSVPCGTKVPERASAALSVPIVSSTLYPNPTMARVPGSSAPPFPQNGTGYVPENTSKLRVNTNGIIGISIVAVLLFLSSSGVIFWCCFLKKRMNNKVLFLRLRKKRSGAELKAPLNPLGVESTQYHDSTLFLKPELDSEPALPRLDVSPNDIRHLKNLEPAEGTPHELSTTKQDFHSPLLGATTPICTDYVQQNSDRPDNNSIHHNSPYFSQSIQGYQDQSMYQSAPQPSTFNVSPPMSSYTNIELDADGASVELSSASHSLTTAEAAGWQYSAETVNQLEEEEKRIDAEIEQIRKLKHLREQKFDVQRRLMEAKTGIRDV